MPDSPAAISILGRKLMSKPASLATQTDSPIVVRRVGVFLGAEITGVDLSKQLDDATVRAITEAHAKHEVLVFPRQKISAQDLMRFGGYFGELSVHPFSTNAAENPELIVYDNKEGNPPAATDVWHTDETFRESPPMGTMLCSKIVPELGGDTMFCSMTAAYDSLSDRMQHFISGLEAVHDFKPFKALFAESEEGWKKLRHFEEIYRR
jgi:taurine dioxygenase